MQVKKGKNQEEKNFGKLQWEWMRLGNKVDWKSQPMMKVNLVWIKLAAIMSIDYVNSREGWYQNTPNHSSCFNQGFLKFKEDQKKKELEGTIDHVSGIKMN